MTTIRAFLKSHPLLSFYTLAFAISWGAILLAVGLGPGGFSATPQQFQKALPYAVPAMFLGPSVACILLTGLLSGRAGFRDLLARMTRWRVGARWYAVALLTAPLVFTAVLLADLAIKCATYRWSNDGRKLSFYKALNSSRTA